MNRKAFTLVELLATITILVVIISISVPQLINSISNKKNDALNKVYDLVESAARNYVIDYNIDLPNIIDLDELCDRYMDCPVINPITDEKLGGYVFAFEDYYYVDGAEVSLTVEYNGGTKSQTFNSVYQTATIIQLANTTKENSDFKGWEVVKGNSIIKENKLIIGSTDTIVHARWENWPTFTIELNDGVTTQEFDNGYKSGTTFELINPTKEGYRFLGWTVTEGNSVLSGSNFTMGSEDTILTANFVPLVIQAIYSATDNSLTFINDVAQTKGGTYNGKVVTEVFTGFTTTEYDETAIPWYSYRKSIKKVEFKDEIYPTSLKNWFRGFSSCTGMNLKKLNTSKVTSLYHAFDGMSSLTTLDVSHFDTSNVTSMSTVFKDCSKIKTLDLSNWNTSNVTGMHVMFSGMSSLTTLNISNFNTSKVTLMYEMFYACKSLTTLNISNFNTLNVTNMSGMFNGCSSLTSLNISNFNTSKVTSMLNMFNGCSSLTTLDLSSFNTSKVTNMTNMFTACNSLTALDLSHFDTSNVTSMKWMFTNCWKLTSLNISNWNTSKVTDMYEMFSNLTSLTTLDVSHFDTSNVTTMYAMFYSCNKLTTLDLSSFNPVKVTNMSKMFNGMTKLKTIYVGDKWTTATVTASTDMFTGCSSITGGMGTTYNSSYLDKTYAKIDGGASSPGYFTSS